MPYLSTLRSCGFENLTSNPTGGEVFKGRVYWNKSNDTLYIYNGSSWVAIQTTSSTLQFDVAAPTTTKGDLVVRNATTNTRLGVGSDGASLVADSAAGEGIKWKKTCKYYDLTFTAQNSQSINVGADSLNAQKCDVTILDTGNSYRKIELDVTRPDVNTITVSTGGTNITKNLRVIVTEAS